jgi:hypothetical protein
MCAPLQIQTFLAHSNYHLLCNHYHTKYRTNGLKRQVRVGFEIGRRLVDKFNPQGLGNISQKLVSD